MPPRARAPPAKRPREDSGSEFAGDDSAGSVYNDSGAESGDAEEILDEPPSIKISRPTGGGPSIPVPQASAPAAYRPPAPSRKRAARDDDDDDDDEAFAGDLEQVISFDSAAVTAAARMTAAAAEQQASGPQGGNGERKKIQIAYIQDKNRRHITFSKRKAGILKKAYELSTLTGTQALLLVVSETGVVYTYTTPKLRPVVQEARGKTLIQNCLANASNLSPQAMMPPKPVQGGVVALKATMPGAPTRGGSLPGRNTRPKGSRAASGSAPKTKGKGKKAAEPPVPTAPDTEVGSTFPPLPAIAPQVLHEGQQPFTNDYLPETPVATWPN